MTNDLDELLDLATAARGADHAPVLERTISRLSVRDARSVNAAAEARVAYLTAAAWNGGWQPVELARHVRRSTDTVTTRFCLAAVAADHAQRDPSTLDPRWTAQLAELELPPVPAGGHWLDGWANALPRPEQLRSIVALLQSLTVVSPIPILMPPPGASMRDGPIIDLIPKVNDPMLDRVRALLAQAESTNFEAEAETFTAKAQQLMTRHAIDMAMLATGQSGGSTTGGPATSARPGSKRIAIDEPYLDAKALLLHVVAESTRCKAVFHQEFAMSSIVGFVHDLDATEALYTSLLVQAQSAMQAAARSAPPGTRARSRSFRSAFLMAYAHRVAARLAEINRQVVADAESAAGRSILPVLAQRSAVVEAAVGEMFGRLDRFPARRRFDAAGWASGSLAADRAQLNRGDLLSPTNAPA